MIGKNFYLYATDFSLSGKLISRRSESCYKIAQDYPKRVIPCNEVFIPAQTGNL